MCPASTLGGSSTGGSHGHEEPKGSHHGDKWGGSPGLLRPLGLTLVPLRDAHHALSPCQWHWCGLARHCSLLEIAVGSCDDPVLVDQGAAAEVGSCAGLGREERRGTGAGWAEHPQAGDRQRSPWCPTVASGWLCRATTVLRAVPREWDSAVPAGTPARAMSRVQHSAR